MTPKKRKAEQEKRLIPEPQLVGYTTVEIESIRQQILKGQNAEYQIVIICPYCLATNIEDKAFCCGRMRDALQMIFDLPVGD